MNLKLWWKIIIAHIKYDKMCRQQGYTLTDVVYRLDPFAFHMHTEFVVKEYPPAGIIDLNNNWEEEGR